MTQAPTLSRIEVARNWIIDLRDEQLGGWPEFKSGRSSSNVSRVSVLGTAEALLALHRTNPPDEVIEQGLELLCSVLLRERPTIRWLYTRHYAIGGLALQTYVDRFPKAANGKYDVSDCIDICLRWLVQAQNATDGGWGHAYDSKSDDQRNDDQYPSKTSATFMALRFLTALPADKKADLHTQIAEGKAYLERAYSRGKPIWGVDYEDSEHDPASTAFALVALKLCDGPSDEQRDVEPALDYLRQYEREHRKEQYLEETELGGDLEDEFGHLWVAWTGLAFLLWNRPLDDPTVMSCVNRVHALQSRLADGSFKDGGFSKALRRRSEIWTTYASLQFLKYYTSSFDAQTDLFDLISKKVEAEARSTKISEEWDAFRKNEQVATTESFFWGGKWIWMRASWGLGMILLVMSVALSLGGIIFLVQFTHVAQASSIANVIGSTEGGIIMLAIYLHTDQRLHWHKSSSISLALTIGVIVGGLLGGALPMLLKLLF